MEALIDEKSVEQIAYENDEDVVNVRHHYNFGMQRLRRMLQAMVKGR